MKDQIIFGNSIEVLKTIEKNSIHAIISDIPYGIGYDEWDVLHKNTNSAFGGKSQAQENAGNIFKRRGKPLNGWSESDKKIPFEYQQWCASWASDWLRVLKPGGSCFIFAGRRYAHRCIAALEDAGFTFKDMIAWEKQKAPHRAQRASAVFERRNDLENIEKWEGWRIANLRPVFEPILWFQKPYVIGGTLTDNIMEYELGAWNETAIKQYSLYENILSSANIFKVENEKTDSGLHVTQKPLRLMELLIMLVTLKGQTVLDPFAGSGTTCVAAKKLQRHYIGIEIDPNYVNIACQRISKIDSIQTLKMIKTFSQASLNL